MYTDCIHVLEKKTRTHAMMSVGRAHTGGGTREKNDLFSPIFPNLRVKAHVASHTARRAAAAMTVRIGSERRERSLKPDPTDGNNVRRQNNPRRKQTRFRTTITTKRMRVGGPRRGCRAADSFSTINRAYTRTARGRKHGPRT